MKYKKQQEKHQEEQQEQSKQQETKEITITKLSDIPKSQNRRKI